METFKWAYLGSGHIAFKTALNVTKGAHKITAVYSRNAESAQSFAAEFGAVAFETLDDLLKNGDFDAVYIATPHTSHVDYAVQAMQAGKPVLCEKPVGVSAQDVETLIRTAHEENVYFCEAMWTWFSDMAYGVKAWIDEKRIGDVTGVRMDYAFPGLMKSKTSRVRDPNTAGGALLDIGIYPITYCYRLFGMPLRIACKGLVKDGIDVRESITLGYDGFDCTLKLSLATLKEGCKITGTNGQISIPLFHVARTASLQSGDKKERLNGITDYLAEFNHAADEIRAGKIESDFVPHQATLDCMKIMDECRKQLHLVYPFEQSKA